MKTFAAKSGSYCGFGSPLGSKLLVADRDDAGQPVRVVGRGREVRRRVRHEEGELLAGLLRVGLGLRVEDGADHPGLRDVARELQAGPPGPAVRPGPDGNVEERVRARLPTGHVHRRREGDRVDADPHGVHAVAGPAGGVHVPGLVGELEDPRRGVEVAAVRMAVRLQVEADTAAGALAVPQAGPAGLGVVDDTVPVLVQGHELGEVAAVRSQGGKGQRVRRPSVGQHDRLQVPEDLGDVVVELTGHDVLKPSVPDPAEVAVQRGQRDGAAGRSVRGRHVRALHVVVDLPEPAAGRVVEEPGARDAGVHHALFVDDRAQRLVVAGDEERAFEHGGSDGSPGGRS